MYLVDGREVLGRGLVKELNLNTYQVSTLYKDYRIHYTYICKCCGETFVSVTHNQKYCNINCRTEFARQKRIRRNKERLTSGKYDINKSYIAANKELL